MSRDICACPPPVETPDLGNPSCAYKIDLVTRLALTTTAQSFASKADAELESNWDIALAAADGTKIQFTPRLAATELPQSEAITFGGNDNTTPDGEELVVGETNPTFVSQLQNLEPAIKKQLKEYECYLNLTAYLVDAKKQTFGKLDADGTTVRPIEIKAFFVGTKGLGGRTDPDQNAIRFTMETGWDEDLVKLDLDFNPLTKINP